MNDILIIQNITREKPGLLSEVLERHQLSATIINLDANEALPESPLGYKAIVVLGGPDSANDVTEKMSAEIAFVHHAIERGIPYLGICLGLQVGVKAMGGQVVKNKVKEIGFIAPDNQQFHIELTDEGLADPLFSGLMSPLAVFQLHGETVELTPPMVLLATGTYCVNQVVRIAPRAYGIQSHFELTRDMLETWATQDTDLIPLDAAKLQHDFAAIMDDYVVTGQRLFTNFLKMAGLIHS